MRYTKLYTDLAAWWPLFSAPEDYAEEAAWILDAFKESLGRIPATVLELGSGGGNTASHLRRHTKMTLVDLNEAMVEVSRRLNPDCENLAGDMRTVRLGKKFEGVLIHDAIMYMTNKRDLEAAIATARAHVATDGVAIVVPDCVAETFEASVESGGHDAADGSGRGVRYLEWTHAPSPDGVTFAVDFALLLRDSDGSVEAHHDRHINGLFPRAVWHAVFARAGFAPPTVRVDPWGREVFVARPV
ncbi:MAG TPA: class I SAM-dependent methyltransferase [Candidatus Binataceae bacterium]|nr:class I SAM-dependent methyltransferase [Candidatus Binataceae bacterium]